jgi:error-prone DNA polymerase
VQTLTAAGVSDVVLEKLADADAFRSLGLDRREALWQVSVKDKPTGMYAQQQGDATGEGGVQLPLMQLPEHVMHDYATLSLSVKAHPVSFLREKLRQLHAVTAGMLNGLKNGAIVKVAGLVLVRQRPETAKGVWFITIEDETGTANLVVFQQIKEQYKKEIVQARLLMVEGRVQIEETVIHIIAARFYDISKMLSQLLPGHDELNMPPLSRADELLHPQPPKYQEKTGAEVIPGGRNFR